MQINRNPFVSNIFSTKWLALFNHLKPVFRFDFISGLRFFKPSLLPIYVNAGRNLTKGISYRLKKEKIGNFKNAVALIYDIPNYFQLDTTEIPDHINLICIKQYPGYLTDLKDYEDINDYVQSNFSNKTKSKLKRYTKRLELCFDVNYKMFYGAINKEEYDFIFNVFKKLLDKRFANKQITNNNLNPEEWAFYYEVAFPMILKKKASLFVVYEGSNPISITLNYFSEEILFHGITVFDIDYSKFHLGKIALLNLFSWSFQNNIRFFDFSKGHYDYKTHWMNKSYDFEYHIYFDRTSLKSKIIALIIKSYFKLKQYLREKELNKTLHRFTFWFKKRNENPNLISNYYFSDISRDYKKSELFEVNLLSGDFKTLKPIANEFMFLNRERLKDLSILKIINDRSTYLLKGKNVSKKLIVN